MYDATYRTAREIKSPAFALSLDPVLAGNVLPAIQAELNDTGMLEARLAKLNVYPTGGFFKAHCEYVPSSPSPSSSSASSSSLPHLAQH